MPTHEITTKQAWLDARRALMVKEKSLTRQLDQLAAERRALPWVRVDASYAFDGSAGPRTLAELFEGRSQLLIYHFMFGPDWEEGCKSCSFWADHFDAAVPHLAARDVTLAVVSRSERAKLAGFAERMGWRFAWYSSLGTDFNDDFRVSFSPAQLEGGEPLYNHGTQKPHGPEMPGLSVFYRDAEGGVFHTYSTYARGLEAINSTYHMLDLVPKGRDEGGLAFTMEWLRLHDEYGA